MNKSRTFARLHDAGDRLCGSVSRGRECALTDCQYSHDLKTYLEQNKGGFIYVDRPDDPGPQAQQCPIFASLGTCPFGYRCRFLDTHGEEVGDGNGFLGSGVQLKHDYNRLRTVAPAELQTNEQRVQWAYETRGEMNVVGQDKVRQVRQTKPEKMPITKAYLNSIGEPLDTRNLNKAKGKGKFKGNNKSKGDDANEAGDDTPDVPLRLEEKKRLRFEGALYMAPLTTVGNLPFRRLCVDYGVDITCGEMGLAQEYLTGNKNEWSLVRRHPSEKMFGLQLCGNRPQTLVAATEMLRKESPDVDFIDVNLGCPIDLVVKKGAGSALLDNATRLGKILKGMAFASGSIPVTIKMRTGIKNGVNTTHKLMPKAVQEWGVGAVTIHGRTQQQRYTKSADYDYIKTCVDSLRSAADEMDVPAIPIFGNGDAYDHRTYWQNVEDAGLDGIMIARGALIKPWIFTEIKERRDWDISSRERLDMIGNLAKYGLEHWGSDTMGVNTTRRFLCEALSFNYRYIPVGLLERLPARMNDRPYPFKGRDDLETLLASGNAADWVKITSMFLGPPPDTFSFVPKHKSNAYGTNDESNG